MSLSTINSEADKPASGSAGWRRYVAWYLSTLLIVCVLVAGFNMIIDPQARFLLVDKPGFNQVKAILKTDTRKGKTTALRQCSYDNIVLGSSRAETAIALDSPPLNDGRSYNAALKAGSMYEMRRLTEYAMLHQDLEVVLLSLDFAAFDTQLIFEDDFSDSPLAEIIPLASLARYLVSLQTLRESLATLKANIRGNDLMCADTGVHKRKRKNKVARSAFDSILRRYSTGPYKRYVSGDLHLRHLAALLQQLTATDVRVYAYISPVHVTHIELLSEMDLLDEYEDWKRGLVQVFTETNQDLPKPQRVVLWDFSGYSQITTEKVPSLDGGQSMRWYSDSSHANPNVGKIMVNRIFDRHPEEMVTATPFGVQLTPDNIEAVIQKAHLDSERYRSEHPDEIRRMQEMLRATR